jgi:hypothetical protein
MAQLAAALGRECSPGVLLAASAPGPATMTEDLQERMNTGLVLHKAAGKDAAGYSSMR